MIQHNYAVVVGNIGTVYSGKDGFKANTTYQQYCGMSKRNYGKATGESVWMLCDGDVCKEFAGSEVEY